MKKYFVLLILAVCLTVSFTLGNTATLLFWDQPLSDEALNHLIQNFQQKYPDIQIKREVQDTNTMRQIISTTLESGKGPDIIYYDTGPGWAGVLAKAGLLMPLDEAYKKFGWDRRILKWAKERATYDGKAYGVGHEVEIYGVFYNKDIFKKLGLKEPKTYEEFIQICEKLKSNGYIPIAFANKGGWPAYHMFSIMASNIAGKEKLAKAISGKISWTDPDFVEAIRIFFVDMNKKGYLIPQPNAVSYDDGSRLFYNGKAAMHMTGTWLIDDIEKNMKAPVGFFPFPSINGKPVYIPAGLGSGYFVSSKTKYSKEAFQFIDYLMSQEAAKIWLEEARAIPPIKIVTKDLNISPLFKNVITTINRLTTTGTFGYNIDVLTPMNFNTVMSQGFQEVLDGKKTPEEVAKELQAAMEEAKQKGMVMEVE
jgi:raffinose/stachyose/melibiose transport system substrate-binding protein